MFLSKRMETLLFISLHLRNYLIWKSLDLIELPTQTQGQDVFLALYLDRSNIKQANVNIDSKNDIYMEFIGLVM